MPKDIRAYRAPDARWHLNAAIDQLGALKASGPLLVKLAAILDHLDALREQTGTITDLNKWD